MIGPDAVERLAQALRAGGVALVPTDTVYGLAAALDVPGGVDALYRIKGRERDQPCQVLVYAPQALDEALAAVDDATAAAARALLPGPVTCLIPDPSGRYAAAAGGAAGSVGLRAPRMAGALAALDLPLVATSANPPGGRDPRAVADVPADLRHGLAYVLDAGPLPGTASAVVDLRTAAAGNARLVRPGPDPDAVAAALAPLGIALQTA